MALGTHRMACDQPSPKAIFNRAGKRVLRVNTITGGLDQSNHSPCHHFGSGSDFGKRDLRTSGLRTTTLMLSTYAALHGPALLYITRQTIQHVTRIITYSASNHRSLHTTCGMSRLYLRSCTKTGEPHARDQHVEHLCGSRVCTVPNFCPAEWRCGSQKSAV